MVRTLLYAVVAYLSGSVLYANILGGLFGARDRYNESDDKNPGTANAYTYGGFWCGTLTLILELAKGAVPVYFFCRTPEARGWGICLVMAAPVIGHIFPIFYDFHGGKGIAVTFGCLIGLFPYTRPLALLAAAFIFFSVCVRIYPHSYRTVAAYALALVLMAITRVNLWVWAGFLAAAAFGSLRIFARREKEDSFEVKLLWMR